MPLAQVTARVPEQVCVQWVTYATSGTVQSAGLAQCYCSQLASRFARSVATLGQAENTSICKNCARFLRTFIIKSTTSIHRLCNCRKGCTWEVAGHHACTARRSLNGQHWAGEDKFAPTAGAGDENEHGRIFDRTAAKFVQRTRCIMMSIISSWTAIIHGRTALHLADAAVQDGGGGASHKGVVAMSSKHHAAQRRIAGLWDLKGARQRCRHE